MHKDKPPGLFDFAERGVRYLVGFWFTTGLVLSILVRTALLILRDDAGASNHTDRNSDAIEAAANARKPAKDSPPPPPAAVRY